MANILTWFIAGWSEGLLSRADLSLDISISLSNIAVGFLTTIICMLLVYRLSVEVQNGLAPPLVFGLFIGLTSISFLFFSCLQYLSGVVVGTLIINMFMIVYLAISAVYLLKLTQNRITPISEAISDKRITEIGNRYNLSRREREIMELLIQGRSATYIAEAEFISFNTVRTHIKRIYIKTNVHKKNELMDLVYGKGN